MKSKLDFSTNWTNSQNKFGIYRIIKEGKVIYIGSTMKTFKERARGHILFPHNYGLQEELKRGGCIFVPSVVFEEHERGWYSKFDILKLEAQLIYKHKPTYNIQFKNLTFEEQLVNDVKMRRYTWEDIENWKIIRQRTKRKKERLV